MYAAQNKQTAKPPPECPNHVSLLRVTGFVAEQEALHLTLCFQKRQAPHVATCIGKLWLAACSARVSAAPLSKVSTTLFGATVAVAADPGLLLLLPSSSDEEATLLAEPSASDTAALGDAFAVSAGFGLLPRLSSLPAAGPAELLAEESVSAAHSLEAVATEGGSGPSSDSELADATGLAALSALSFAAAPSEPSGWDSASLGAAFSDTVSATEALALGEGLAATLGEGLLTASLEDIAAGPGARAQRKATEEDGEDEDGDDDANDCDDVGGDDMRTVMIVMIARDGMPNPIKTMTNSIGLKLATEGEC